MLRHFQERKGLYGPKLLRVHILVDTGAAEGRADYPNPPNEFLYSRRRARRSRATRAAAKNATQFDMTDFNSVPRICS
jgi:hypothetical protein